MYPANVERGGSPSDYGHFVVFVANVQHAFDDADGGWQVTVSLPYDYKNLKGYSLENLGRYVDWFNLRAYGMYDLWNPNSAGYSSTKTHSNITEIGYALDLLGRNGISPDKIVLGYALQGTSYTLSDTGCTRPGCPFDGPGFEGYCSNSMGLLSYPGGWTTPPSVRDEMNEEQKLT